MTLDLDGPLACRHCGLTLVKTMQGPWIAPGTAAPPVCAGGRAHDPAPAPGPLAAPPVPAPAPQRWRGAGARVVRPL